jgi:hypothetical protein
VEIFKQILETFKMAILAVTQDTTAVLALAAMLVSIAILATGVLLFVALLYFFPFPVP